ncbi:C-type lectin domain family 10 member A-like [Hypanus sabinus]|uniref:C-type lectin domain family 10 member A-like n=1 Tax=Hypanus sabinus TaxID=79690 RepID=UPI0028C3D607|nr:C-type lectin domain family 10 member A-like [Hypanus sabinus]
MRKGRDRRYRLRDSLTVMDGRETYMNVKFTKTDSRFPSPAEPDVTYAELNVKTLSEARDRTGGEGLKSTYSELNFRKEEPRIDEAEDPPISSGPGGLTATAQTGAQKQKPKQNIGNRPDRRICLLLLVTIGLVAIVAGLSIYVSQTRHFLITSERNYQRLREQDHEMNRTQLQYQQQVSKLNSTLKSRTSENTRLDLSQRNCQKNLSALSNNLTILENNFTTLNSDLSDLNRKHSDLCHQFNQLEIKYRNINENKAQICQYLARRRETTCPHNWIKKEDRCYFISEITKSYDGAMGHCSEYDSRLLEIDSDEEKKFVSSAVYRYVTYWIGKCADRNVASDLLYELNHGSPTCSKCESDGWSYFSSYSCKSNYRFICEKTAPFYPDIPEKIRGLCQDPVGPTSIK